MQINTIEIKGFASYKDYSLVQIPNGITGIVGTIEDVDGKSNGSGKTSIVMSLLFALYGTGTYDRTEEVWNDKLLPTEDAYVRINFSLSGNTYSVTRGRKEKASYLDVIENGNRIGSSVKESQEFLNSLLGMDSKLFLASVFFSQGDLASCIEMDPKDRKDYIDSIIDLEVWREAGRNCTKEYKKTSENIENLQNLIESKTEELKILSEEINSINTDLEKLPILRKEKENKEKLIEVARQAEIAASNLNEQKSLLANAIEESVDLAKRQSKIEESIKILATEYEVSKEKQNNNCEFSEDEISSNTARIKKEKISISMEIGNLENELKEILQNISYINSTKDNLEESLELIRSGKCDRCGRDFSAEEIESKSKEIEVEVASLSEKISDLIQNKKSSLENNIKLRKEAISALEKDLDEYEVKLRILESINLDNVKLEANYKEKTAVYMSELKLIGEYLVENKTKVTKLTTKVSELSNIAINTNIPSINDLISSIKEIDSKIEMMNVIQGKLQKIQEDNEQVKNTIKDSKLTLKNLTESIYFLEVLNDAFKQIPTQILKDSVVNIEKYANEIIRAVFPKFKLKIYEDESKKNRPIIVAFEVDGKYRNYKLLSGGQQSICAIGLRIGFNRVISEKAKVSLNFLVLDEIFGSLDEVNRIEVMKLLGGIVKTFPQILVITHTEEVSSFPNIIHVSMDSLGNSSVKQFV